MATATKTYYTHDNGARPFKVEINETDKEIKVFNYKKTPRKGHERDEHYVTKWSDIDGNELTKITYYDPEPIETYDELAFVLSSYIKFFVGKSQINRMTTFSGGHGEKFDGNSILAQVSESKYVFIGHEIFEFTTNESDEIVKFESPVGNNDVPYPTAIGNKFIYLILSRQCIERELVEAIGADSDVAYDILYDHRKQYSHLAVRFHPFDYTVIVRRPGW